LSVNLFHFEGIGAVATQTVSGLPANRSTGQPLAARPDEIRAHRHLKLAWTRPAAFCRTEAAGKKRNARDDPGLWPFDKKTSGRKAAGFLHNSFQQKDYGMREYNHLPKRELRRRR